MMLLLMLLEVWIGANPCVSDTEEAMNASAERLNLVMVDNVQFVSVELEVIGI